MSRYKDPNVRGRKFNGSAHLKFKMVKQSPPPENPATVKEFRSLGAVQGKPET